MHRRYVADGGYLKFAMHRKFEIKKNQCGNRNTSDAIIVYDERYFFDDDAASFYIEHNNLT